LRVCPSLRPSTQLYSVAIQADVESHNLRNVTCVAENVQGGPFQIATEKSYSCNKTSEMH